MNKVCQQCSREFWGRSHKKFCHFSCRDKYHSAKRYQLIKMNGRDPMEIVEWKQDYIRKWAGIRTVEAISFNIKKSVEAVLKFSEDNNLPIKSRPIKATAEPPRKPIQRPPAEYDNHKRKFPYYIALL